MGAVGSTRKVFTVRTGVQDTVVVFDGFEETAHRTKSSASAPAGPPQRGREPPRDAVTVAVGEVVEDGKADQFLDRYVQLGGLLRDRLPGKGAEVEHDGMPAALIATGGIVQSTRGVALDSHSSST